ncbi:hypothetical protein MBLNU459_g3520t2 [Dothideomycetes sp. NU459]
MTTLLDKENLPRSPRLGQGAPNEISKFQISPPLPPNWTVVHDRAICVLDTCGYSLKEIVKKLRNAFTELTGQVITPSMIDKRLRTLDQIPDIDYFRIGLDRLRSRSTEYDTSRRAGNKESSKSGGCVFDDCSLPRFPSISKIAPEWEESRKSVSDTLREGKGHQKVQN